MLKKNYTKTRRTCRVTFKVTDVEAQDVVLLGDFNAWDQQSHPMKHRKDGSFSTTISLDTGKAYRFRYLADGGQWLNDDESDRQVFNKFGSVDSVIQV
ncbi:MAG: isoamylase early set domain-containing protein [Acidobacteriota bacterium]